MEAIRGRTILLVEDEDAVRRLGIRVLERAGFEVRVAADAETGLELFERAGGELALIITDVRLPGRSGPAFAESLRRRRPDLKVLLISGDASDEAAASAASMAYLAKPFTSAALIDKVRELLRE